MKKGRSNVYTEGLCCVFADSKSRICLFELDADHLCNRCSVLEVYRTMGLDCLVHRTGNGIHFLSPTLVTPVQWKEFHSKLKGINPKCPMTTLRTKPNKYIFEPDIWYNYMIYRFAPNDYNNSIEVCNLLNHWFCLFADKPLTGRIYTTPKIVRYPLPL